MLTGDLGQVQQAIITGTPSDASQDSTVMVVSTEPVFICTGTLIAPKLVITARHCLSVANVTNIACDTDGRPLIGGEIKGDLDPAKVLVFTGKDRPPFTQLNAEFDASKLSPTTRGAEILDDFSGNLCSHDIGLLVLQTPITNMPIAQVRLDRDVTAGENVTTVGWGVEVNDLEPAARKQRTNVVIDRVGPDPSYPLLTTTEFSFGESICSGDSGGPIFDSATKALVGVISRGSNSETKTTEWSTCLDARNLGTKLSTFKQLITDGYARAGAEPKLEPPPDDDGCRMAPGANANASKKKTTPTALLGALALACVLLLRRRTR